VTYSLALDPECGKAWRSSHARSFEHVQGGRNRIYDGKFALKPVRPQMRAVLPVANKKPSPPTCIVVVFCFVLAFRNRAGKMCWCMDVCLSVFLVLVYGLYRLIFSVLTTGTRLISLKLTSVLHEFPTAHHCLSRRIC
jgi:hypothetical protein